MPFTAVHRDFAKPGPGRRAVLRGQSVYRIQPDADDHWPANLPTNEEQLTRWLERLSGTGIDVLWLASGQPDQGTGFGRCLTQRSDLINTPALPLRQHAMAEAALSVGLRVLVDLPGFSKHNDALPDVYTPPLPKLACYRWTDHRQSLKALDAQECDGFNPLRITQCHAWAHQECKAPYAHAALTHFYRSFGRGWPLWWVGETMRPACPQAEETAPESRALLLSVALPMCLKGSPLLDHPQDGEPREVPRHVAHFLRWRRTVPALLYGQMQLLGMHENLLMFIRQDAGQCVLCVFNLSERFVRQPLPPTFARFSLIAGSGLEGGRIVDRDIDCDPWGALFAQPCGPLPLKSH